MRWLDRQYNRENPMNILVFSFCRLGDSLVMLPMLHLLRDNYPHARILLLSQAEETGQFVGARAILEGRGLVDDFLSFPVEGGWLKRHGMRLKLAWQLRRHGVEIGIVGIPAAPPLEKALLRNMVLFLRMAGARQILAPSSILQGEHLPKAADELLGLLSPLGVEIPCMDCGNFTLPKREDYAREADKFTRKFPKGRVLVAMAVGGNRSSQRWPLERFEELARRLSDAGGYLVLFGGPGDVEAMERVRGKFEGTIVTATVGVSAEVLRRCSFYVGNDTGVMHLAVSVGLKCVCIFSARNPPGVWEPYGTDHAILLPHPPCEGCLCMACPLSTPCILTHTVADVWEACQPFFKQQGK
ncbi:MAG: glycosyltransferase family 9 protein [Victivallales bacterium]|nr:glycosyltransferase family 9 protein [Victivallales bacterium]